jgi:GT2 family glycosyltransferase
MNISVIIPTYRRPKDLDAAINSILLQSVLPNEIIIVDSANDKATKNIANKFLNCELDIKIKYIYNKIDSSAVARNIGAEYSTSDILLFLDDDAILRKDYIKYVLDAYGRFDNALIVQGNIISEDFNTNLRKRIWNKSWQYYNRFFNLFHQTSGKMNVLKSGRTTSPPDPSSIINCEWAVGCNFSIKKDIFEKYKFDSNLMKYSYGEDKDLSYRIHKKYPQSVYLIPEAHLIHNGSFNRDAPVKRAIIAEKVYALYFVAKNLNKPINYLFFAWSEAGNFFADFIQLLFFYKRHKRYFALKLKYDLYAYFVCIKYFYKIKKLNLDSINSNYIL